MALGAHAFAATRDGDTFERLARAFDFVADRVSAPPDYSASLGLLKAEGAMVLPGVPEQPAPRPAR